MRAAGVEANLVPPGPGAFSGGALGGADGLPCRTREGPTRRGQAGWMGRLGQPYGEPGLHGRCGACPAGGRCELVVGYNRELQPRAACRHSVLCPAMVARRSFLLSEDAGRPPQQPGCPGRSDGWGTPAIEPKWRRRLIRAAHGNFTRRASSSGAWNGWRGPQGRQPKENPPSLFSVEKTK